LHFPGGDWTHKALNRLIQGSAADQAKAALVLLDQAGFKLMLQVHDEFDLSVSSREEGEKAAALMRTAHHAFKAFAGTGVDDASGSKYNGTSAEKARKQAAEIPFKVDVEVGPNWGKVK
jgi:DNA polymerase I-like protein with 3'-5' exonuclease and polymerase domains